MKEEKIIYYGNLEIYLAAEDGCLVEVQSINNDERERAGELCLGCGKENMTGEHGETSSGNQDGEHVETSSGILDGENGKSSSEVHACKKGEQGMANSYGEPEHDNENKHQHLSTERLRASSEELNKAKSKEAEILEEAERQLREYFNGERKEFDLPLRAEGTEFQKEVWKAISEIPYGETRTYGEIAKAVGRPKGARACGQAANRNPLQFVVPCHRVVGKGGKLVGYAGGVSLKTSLLEMENIGFRFHKNNT